MTAIIVYSCLTMCIVLLEMLKLIFYLLIIRNKFYLFILISIALITISIVIVIKAI